MNSGLNATRSLSRQKSYEYYLGEDEREDEVEELDVATSFLFLLFEDFFGGCSLSSSLELVLFDLFIFILRLGDSGCGKTAAEGWDCKAACFSASMLEAVLEAEAAELPLLASIEAELGLAP